MQYKMMVSPSEGAVIAIVHRNDETGQDFETVRKQVLDYYERMLKECEVRVSAYAKMTEESYLGSDIPSAPND